MDGGRHESVEALTAEAGACRRCADRFAATRTAHAPRPILWLSDRAPVLIASQAPGARAQAAGVPFEDASGDRLRAWLGVDRTSFYDRARFAILPMAFCFPGYDATGADLPPPRLCAATWRSRALLAMPRVRLTLLVGGHAQRWRGCAGGVTETVARWREFAADTLPLPHPSWRNTAWLRRNPWFETELVPELRRRIAALVGGA